ncbi:MAG: hypothetical protein E7354_03120 [Clostridiales bacterium]|nr:hypothetical protein [Clostridiales bacterium]
MATNTTKTTKTETKKPATKTTTKTTTRSNAGSNSIFTWGINKLSMYTIFAVAFLYALSTVLALCNVQLKVISALQGLATAVMICIVAVLAWRYASTKELVWRLLYIICLLVVLSGIVIPLVA